uniref:Rhodanese domain-containing protein n=1 Tax=Attheya septentrionalis TaxID=420275 RepID=A0A7S2XRH6_9STRA|mmetsp:Transcript_5079/g.8919  ORF Transcript_5079/g.8919 Transcript_5079/m.8919 type:complete len:111 (+) Transcript_5079:105-437(+)
MTGERASKEEIKEAAARPDVVFLDVRTEPEIAENPLTSRPFVAVECNVTDSSILEAKIDTVLTDKDAPIVIFCRSGRRAETAIEVLKQRGFTHTYNGGGVSDLETNLRST